jgi:hypothetical protein
LDYTERDGSGALSGSGTQANSGVNAGVDGGIVAGFRHKTPTEGREWSTDLTYNRNRRENRSDFITSALDASGTPVVVPASIVDGTTKADNFTWQFDMQDPRNERTRWITAAEQRVWSAASDASWDRYQRGPTEPDLAQLRSPIS